MTYQVLALYADKVCHMASVGGDASHADVDAVQQKMLKKADAMYGWPSAMMILNDGPDGLNNGYEATMAKVTHDMWGKEIAA